VRKSERPLLTALPPQRPVENRQRRLMVGALALLLIALGLLLYKDRDFWFPDDMQEADELPSPPDSGTAAPTPTSHTLVVATAAPSTSKRQAKSRPQLREAAPEEPDPPFIAVTHRTVLPPLEVEVVAGDAHRSVRPGSNSVHVDMQPGSPPQPEAAPVSNSNYNDTLASDSTASLTSNAAERVQMSADTAENVSRPVKPGYPVLARQMKVQGSVILQALISKEGFIQNLHVVSGPPILAGAAEEAVKQWHFKPHYQNDEAVETQAKITVNFTISTN
jgi:TonB family protein